MSTILNFKADRSRARRDGGPPGSERCEIVIFPGVRIERQSFDLGHRLRDSVGRGEFSNLGGKHRPAKTS